MNLVIGRNSQLSKYFKQSNTHFVSARNFDLSNAKDYEKVFFFFCEQRTFLNLTEKDFCNINVDLTFKILDKLYNEKTKFYLFGTGELWNNCQGGVTIKTPFNYKNTPYVKSKHILTEKLNAYREENNRKNILLFHPFNFNTPYRTSGFLFAKIFDSLINRTKITTGDLNFSRDLVHPSFILKRVFESFEDGLIGSGHVTNIRDFIDSLYKFFDMNRDDFLTEETSQVSRHNNCFFHETSIKYNTLLEDTIKDINEFKHNKISI